MAHTLGFMRAAIMALDRGFDPEKHPAPALAHVGSTRS
jgi:hypothetical protein